jgi:hypothetical protein
MKRVAKTTKKDLGAVVETAPISTNSRYIVKKHLRGQINNKSFHYPIGTILELDKGDAYLFRHYIELVA